MICLKMQILKNNHAFSHVIRRGKRLPGRTLNIYYRKRRDKDPSRIGVTCSKGLGNAVVRNHKRRQLREIARSLLPALPRGYDFIFMARGASLNVSYQAMRQEAQALLESRQLYRAELLPAEDQSGDDPRVTA